MRHSALFIIVCALLLATPGYAQEADQESMWAERIAAAADSARVVGFSIASIEDGAVDWTYNYGERSSATAPQVTDQTVFEAGALSKPLFAYIVLKLADQGRLDLDTPLSEYAPYSDLSGDPRYDQVTARLVLMHASGLPHRRAPGGDLSFDMDPGLVFSFSSEGFEMLQHVVERITFRRLDALARELVFTPLGMTSTSFEWKPAFGDHIAVGHNELNQTYDKFLPNPESASAAFTLHTTASDYARFAIAFAQGEGLDASTFQDAVTAQIDAYDGVYWGLGWGLEPRPGGQALWHWGDNTGYKSFVWVGPDANDGFVYLSNSNDGMFILHEVFDLLVGGQQRAVRWLDYERYDDPKFVLGRMMLDEMLASGVEAGLAVYDAARDDMPDEAYVELTLNNLGYRLLRLGMTEEAIAVFERNTEEYPDAFNTFDSLGEAYLNARMYEAALRNYRRSVELEPGNQGAYQMIALIEQQMRSLEDS